MDANSKSVWGLSV